MSIKVIILTYFKLGDQAVFELFNLIEEENKVSSFPSPFFYTKPSVPSQQVFFSSLQCSYPSSTFCKCWWRINKGRKLILDLVGRSLASNQVVVRKSFSFFKIL
jgi:hypothetical protein